MKKRTGKRQWLILGAPFLLLAIAAILLLWPQRDGETTEQTAVESAASGSAQPEAGQTGRIEQTEASETEESTPAAFVWQTDSPEAHGLSSDFLSALHSDFDATEIQSCVIVRDDRVIDEYYEDDYTSDTVFAQYSASKSVTSTLLGIAIDHGYLEGTDVPISRYFPEIDGASGWEDITIRHLLTHTSGIDMTDTADWEDWIGSGNWVQNILSREVTAAPGTEFRYSTGNTHLLSAILEQATGMSLYAFGETYLFEPLGMESVQCSTDPQGIADGGNGFSMSVMDMLKLGRLYLNNGSWEGQQIVSAEWIQAATSVQFVRNSGSADYGYQWWVRQFQGYDAYFAQGHYGQFLFVVPEQNLIAAFTSHNTGGTDKYWQFINEIVSACA